MSRKHNGLSFYHKRKRISSSLIREILSWVFGIFVTVFIACVAVYFAGMTISMIGASMEPTIANGEKVYINRLVYLISSPKEGDVIVFLPNGNEKSHYYVKRVVATPGDTVQIIDGRLYVNGEMEQTGPVVFDKMTDPGIAQNPLVLKTDEYFVLGDNRNHSEDSRAANIGTVQKQDILGKAWFHSGGDGNGIGLIR